jgi:ABC-2 type transport system permease protein
MSVRSGVTSIRRFVRVVLRQLVGDRTAMFFLVVLPVVVITVIGITFGTAGELPIGVVRDDSGSAFADAVEADLDAADAARVERYGSVDDLRSAVRRRTVALGVVFPADLDARVASGESLVVAVADAESPDAQVALDVVRAALADQLAPTDAARFAAGRTGVDEAAALDVARSILPGLPGVEVRTVDTGDRRDASLSAFSLTAPQNLVLFVFINALAAGSALVRMRRMGVLRRVLAGPTSAREIVVGLGVAWFGIALLQSVLIVGIGSLAFGVDWGDPVAAALVVVTFAAVGAGAGLLVGALGADEDRVTSMGPPVGIVLGALGGCMVPLEVFPPVMRAVSRVVPHSWAMTAWERLVFDGAGLSAVAGPLLVLAAFATAFVGLAATALHRDLVGPRR